MENKIKLIAAVAASFTANCQPCLRTALTEAQKAGVEEKEIREAIAIGRIVRKGAMGKMDKFASTLIGRDAMNDSNRCPFGSTEEDVKEWVEHEDSCGCS